MGLNTVWKLARHYITGCDSIVEDGEKEFAIS
jgi:hypothetical protein